MSEIRLGKNERVIDTNKIKGGVKRENMKTDAQLRIFDAFNTVKNGGAEILDDNEIKFIMQMFLDNAGDDKKLGKSDVKKICANLNLKGIKEEDLFAFVEQILASSEDIAQTHTAQDGSTFVVHEHAGENENQLITTEEQYNAEGAKLNVTTTTNFNSSDPETRKMTDSVSVKGDVTIENGKQVIRNGEQILRSYIAQDGNVVLDENGNEVLQSETTRQFDKDGYQISETNTEYNADGSKSLETVTKGLTVEEFEFMTNKEGQEIRMPVSKVENKGLPTETTTYFTVNNEGTVTESVTTGNNKEIRIQYQADGKTLKQITLLENDNLTRVVYSEDGSYVKHEMTNVTTTTDEEGKPHYNADNLTSTTYTADRIATAQKKTVDGKEYIVNYDGEGNTVAVVQYGEDAQKIADKFDCDRDLLIELNGEDAFKTGNEIKIPGELDADAKVLQGRGTSAQEIRKEQRANAIAAAKRAAKEECKGRVLVKDYRLPYEIKISSLKTGREVRYVLDSAEKIARYLYRLEGQNSCTEEALKARTRQIIDDNKDMFDSKTGKLNNPRASVDYDNLELGSTIKLDLHVNTAKAELMQQEATDANDILQLQEEHKRQIGVGKLVRSAREAISGSGTDTRELTKAVNQINSGNVLEFLEMYEKSSKESFVKAIRGESAVKGTNLEKKYLDTIRKALRQCGNELGIFESNYLDNISASSSTQTIEDAIHTLTSRFSGIKILAPSAREAACKDMLDVIDSSDVNNTIELGKNNVDEANKILKETLENDDLWGDLWEGIKTVGTLGTDADLDENVRAAINDFSTKLKTVQNKYNQTHDIEKFKAEFKKQFGVKCNSYLMNQYTDLTKRINVARNLEAFNNYFDNYKNMTENDLRQKFLDLQKENPKILGEGVDVNTLSKDDMVRIIDYAIMSFKKDCGFNGNIQDLYDIRSRVGRKLFGSLNGKNDVVFRALHYAENQQKGSAYLGMGVKVVATMAVAYLTAGVGLCTTALAVGGTSFTLDMSNTARKSYHQGRDITWGDVGNAAKEAVITGAMVYIGGNYYRVIRELPISKIGQGTALVLADVATGATVEAITTGEITFEGTLITGGLSLIIGNVAGAKSVKGGKSKNTGKSKAEPTVLDKATSNGAELPGGKLSEVNFARAVDQTAAELPTATAERAAQIHVEGQRLQTQSRSQGSYIQHLVGDNVGVVSVGKERINIKTADRPTLLRVRKVVEGWSDGSRNKQALLDNINLRLAEPDAALSGRGTAVREILNTETAQQAKAILSGKSGKPIAPSDARALKEHIANNLNTVEELEQFIAQLKNRVGTYPNGKMFVMQVQGVDHAAKVLQAAEGKIRNLQKPVPQAPRETQPVAKVEGNETYVDSHTIVMKEAPKAPSTEGLPTPEFREVHPAATPEKSVKTPEFKPAATEAIAQESEFLSQQFNTKLQESGIYQTAHNQSSVERLGGEKVRTYTHEFDELCRYATTLEQLEQLRSIAGKFKGQAERTAFETSIAKRSAELNAAGGRANEIRVNEHEIITNRPVVNNESVPTVEFRIPSSSLTEQTKIQVLESIADIKALNNNVFRDNVANIRSGNLSRIQPNVLPEGAIIKLYEKGLIATEDLPIIFSEGAGLISKTDFNYFAIRRIKLTKFDTPEIIEARYYNATNPALEVGSSYYNSVRETILAEEMPEIAKAASEGKMMIVTGLPGSGKSTVVKVILGDNYGKYYSPDADRFKARFTEFYAGGKGSNLVHKPSTTVLKQDIMPRVLAEKKNIIYQTTGGEETLNKIIEQARANGYEVEIVHANIQPELSMERALGRYLDPKDGRFLDPYVTLSIYNEGSFAPSNIPSVMGKDLRLTNLTVYDTNGKSPRFVEKIDIK